MRDKIKRLIEALGENGGTWDHDSSVFKNLTFELKVDFSTDKYVYIEYLHGYCVVKFWESHALWLSIVLLPSHEPSVVNSMLIGYLKSVRYIKQEEVKERVPEREALQEPVIESDKDAAFRSVMCSCDGCGKQFEYKKVKAQMEVAVNLPMFGEYAVCDDCEKKGLEFQ